jgi:Ca2+-binding EF-hand superfamily protein
MNPIPSLLRRGIRVGTCLAAVGVAFAAGESTAFQAQDSKPAAPPIDYQALEQPPQNGIRLAKFLEGVPETQRSAKQWKFYERDADGDGWLSIEEAANNDATDVSPIAKRFRGLDVDTNGFLSRAEYVEPADPKLQGDAKTNFTKAAIDEFALYDRDEDGKLSFEEFCFTPRLNLAATPKFRRLDADHNGRLTIGEFLSPYVPSRRFKQRPGFFNSDADNDQQLGLEEFTKKGQGVVLSLKNEYLIRDANDDGRMSREEFVLPALGQPWEASDRKLAEEFDMDGDGFISLPEFAITRQGRYAEMFGLLDKDGDGYLTLAEYAKPRPKSQGSPGPVFFATDLDADNRLSREEFLDLEKPPAERRTRPDAMAALVRNRLEQIAPACQAADSDKDGRLSTQEWPHAKLDGLVPELTGIPFAEWDRDKDGFVTGEERKELVELAFGVALPGGVPLRKPGGIVLGHLYFDYDKDKDGIVSRDEYIASHWNKEKSPELFKEYDKDGDGKLSLAEAAVLPEMFMNVCPDYLKFDADFDGRVTRFEFEVAAPLWEWATTAGLAAFDVNGDGGLQFDEYLLCPRGNPRAAAQIGRKDADNDGRLSWEEFHPDKAVLFYGLSRYFFLRHDRNGDGFLTFSEFSFNVEMNKAPPPPSDELAEFERPRPGAVTFEKFTAGVPDVARAAKTWQFYEHDLDADRLLSEEELAIDDPTRVSPHVQHFRRLDVDRDGSLSRTEYVEPADSKREGDAKANFERVANIEFAMFDRDDDELLSFEEFCFTSRLDLPLPPYFRRLDADHDGRLSCLEFIAPYGPLEQNKQRINFYNWDVDNDQQLSLYEMMRRGNGVTPSLKNQYLARDIDGDGKVSLEEFVREALGQPFENNARKQAEEFDVDGDGFLSLLEFSLHRGHDFAELFALQDVNRDGSLSYLEFRQPYRPEVYPQLGQPFFLADLDGNGVLSLEEYLELKKPGNEKEKRVRPDVLVLLADGRLKQIAPACKAADADKDGRLSATEWPQAEIDRLVPELVGISFAHWDRNGDGYVTPNERKELVELALGVALPGGRPLRHPGGRVLGPIFFGFDKDKNGEVSRDEFMEAHWDKEKKADLFKAWDVDGDGRLTLAEAAAVNDLFTNIYADFFWFDKDFDGQVTQKELDGIAHPWEKHLVDHLVSAFDLNGDEALQLDEYVLSPKGNPYAAQLMSRTDADNDGWLSWEEFYPGEPGTFYGLLQSFFGRYDRDQDGVISLRELDFKIDMNAAAPESVFVKLDRNGDGKLLVSDLLDPKVPDANDPPAVLRHEEQTIRIEEAFALADTDGDGMLSVAELGKHRAVVIAAVEGRSIPVRATRADGASPTRTQAGLAGGAAAGDDADDYRWMAILGFNALLVSGVAWMVLKGK